MDVEKILSIPVSLRPCEDALIWHFEKKGIYSVRSGYRLAIQEQVSENCPNNERSRRWWRKLWSLNIPPKVRIFVWRCCVNAIPSMMNLYNRGVPVQSCCFLCGEEVESTEHAVLWGCQTMDVWRGKIFWKAMAKMKGLRCLDVLQFLSLSLKREELEQVCMILWSCWWNRNQWLHKGKPKEGERLLEWSVFLLAEFQGTVGSQSIRSTSSRSFDRNEWEPPPAEKFKMNTDVPIKPGRNTVGIGVVIRNSEGRVCVALSKTILGVFEADLGELLAIREGLLLARKEGLNVHMIETDATNAAALITDDKYRGVAAGITSDIKALGSEVGLENCTAVPRNRNVVAHCLASLACSSYMEQLWKGTLPDCIYAF